MEDTKKGISLIGMIGIAVVVVVAGSMMGVDFKGLATNVFAGGGKEVCFSIRNAPRQSVYIAWHVGAEIERFQHPKFHAWDKCRPAKTGDRAALSAEKSREGTMMCTITQMPGEAIIGGPQTTKGRDNCAVFATVL